MTTHELKCDTAFFQALKSGEKTFELRYNDRGFQKGDRLLLREMQSSVCLDSTLYLEITYVHGGPPWMAPGFVALAVKPISLSAMSTPVTEAP